jgi:F420-0:gamma-glutamyl ligase
VGDLLVSAAGLVMGESDQGVPAALISGLPSLYRADGRSHDTAAKLLRPAEGDLFL